MKKRIMVLAMVALLVGSVGVSGCQTLSAVGAAIVNVAQKVCDFTTAEATQAQGAANFIGTVASLITVNGAKINSDAAAATFMAVYNAANTGTCVAAADLTNAIDYFNALAVAYQAASTTKSFRAANPVPNIDLLRKRVGK